LPVVKGVHLLDNNYVSKIIQKRKEMTKMKEIIKIAELYQCDVEIVLDLLKEGFTLEEAAEIIREAEY